MLLVWSIFVSVPLQEDSSLVYDIMSSSLAKSWISAVQSQFPLPLMITYVASSNIGPLSIKPCHLKVLCSGHPFSKECAIFWSLLFSSVSLTTQCNFLSWLCLCYVKNRAIYTGKISCSLHKTQTGLFLWVYGLYKMQSVCINGSQLICN